MAKKIKRAKRSPRGLKKIRRAGLQEAPSLQAMFRQALSLHKAGNLPQAEDLYRQILWADPSHPEAMHLLGLLAHQVGKPRIGVEMIGGALTLRPDYAEAHNNLGLALNDLGRPDEAVACYRRALDLKPDFVEALYNLGNALKDQGKPEDAFASYSRALTLRPDFADAHYNLGIVLQEQGKLDEAIASYRQALRVEPDKADTLNTLGVALTKQARLAEAVDCFRQAIILQPDYAEAYNNLGITLTKLDRLDEGVDCFRQAVSLKPDEAETYYNLGNALKDKGNPDEAVDCFRQAVSLKPDYAEAHYNLGFIFRQLGRVDEATACFRKALSLKPDYAQAYKGLSLMLKYTEVDEYTHAMEDLYNKIENADGDRIVLGFALGKIFEDLRNYKRSFAFLLEANRLKRASYQYSIQDDFDLFARIKTVFSPDFFASHQGSGNEDKTPIFILGMPRSGTTLVEQILASHSLVFGAGELTVLENLTGAACPRSVSKQFPECMLDLGMETFKTMGSQYLKKIHEYSRDAEYITDKLPHNFMRVGTIRAILPNAKVIHCMRNAMDTCLSIFKKDFTGAHPYAYDLAELGQYYNLYRDLMAHWEKVLPGFMHTLKYEELVTNQRKQTKRLLDFCGLPWDEACLDFHKTERRVSTASLAQVRQPIYKDSIGLWKRYEKQLEPLRKAIYGRSR
jgi:tetratricopeptide (TPR) repeat protein